MNKTQFFNASAAFEDAFSLALRGIRTKLERVNGVWIVTVWS